MKKLKWILILLAAVILALILWFVLKPGDGGVIGGGGMIMDGDGMINPAAIESISYRRGGGMLGAFYNVSLEDDRLTIESCEGNGMKTVKKTRTISPEDIGKIEDIIYDSGMRDWGVLPKNDMIALDAETTSVTVYYCDGASVSFGSDDVLPEGGWDAVGEVIALLEASAG